MEPLDSRLDSVKRMALKLPDLESLYVVGSAARHAQTPKSDLDLVVVTRKPTFNKRYSRLLLLTNKGIDFNVISTSLIAKLDQGETTPYAPLLRRWRSDGILLHGTDTLPKRIPLMDAHAKGVFAFFVASWFLWHFAAADNSLEFVDEDFSKRWMIKTVSQMKADKLMDSEWRNLGDSVASEVAANCDPRAICGLIAEDLRPRIRDLNFSRSDQRRFVIARLRSQKRLSWRSAAYKTTVQERAMRAMYLLFASAHENLESISEVPLTVRDFVRVPQTRDPAILWNKMQRSILQELQLILASGDILVA